VLGEPASSTTKPSFKVRGLNFKSKVKALQKSEGVGEGKISYKRIMKASLKQFPKNLSGFKYKGKGPISSIVIKKQEKRKLYLGGGKMGGPLSNKKEKKRIFKSDTLFVLDKKWDSIERDEQKEVKEDEGVQKKKFNWIKQGGISPKVNFIAQRRKSKITVDSATENIHCARQEGGGFRIKFRQKKIVLAARTGW